MSAPDTGAALTETVRAAIEELEQSFRISVEPTGDGGAVITVHELAIGQRWQPNSIDLLFEVLYNYPHAPIYPYYTTSDLTRGDSAAWPSALQRVAWRGAQRTQISLRANRWNPSVDTAVGAVLQVQKWFLTVQ